MKKKQNVIYIYTHTKSSKVICIEGHSKKKKHAIDLIIIIATTKKQNKYPIILIKLEIHFYGELLYWVFISNCYAINFYLLFIEMREKKEIFVLKESKKKLKKKFH